eukprot:13867730-Ditylum_brightwellii.AAC.1
MGICKNYITLHLCSYQKVRSGGLQVRLAASTLYYNRCKWHKEWHDKSYYFLMKDDQGVLYK